MFYFSGEIVPDSNDLQFNETLVCGDLASVTVEFACYDLDGETDCIPAQTDADADADSDSADADSDTTEENEDAVSKRSLEHLEKRAGATCNEWTLACSNSYQSTTGYCASGYTFKASEVGGQTADIWCAKPCTAEEKKVCQDQKCPKGKQQCEKFGYSRDCVDALAICAGSPVKMPEDVCTTKYFPGGFEKFCNKKNPPCLGYEDGACTLSASQFKAFEGHMMGVLNIGF